MKNPMNREPSKGTPFPPTTEFTRRCDAIDRAPVGARFAPLVRNSTKFARLASGMHVAVDREIAESEASNAKAMQIVAQQAENGLSAMTGGGSLDAREAAANGARARALEPMRAEFTQNAIVKLGERPLAISTQFAAAGRALEAEIRRARIEYMGPASLRKKMPELAEVLTIARLEQELTMMGSIESIAVLYADAIEAKDVERQEKIEAAATPILHRALVAPDEHARKRAALGGRLDDGDASHAVGLLHAFERQKQARLPPEIAAAAAALEEIKRLFGELCGFSAKYLSRGAFASAYLSGNGMPGDFDADPTWPARFAPPSEFMLPGWSSMRILDDAGRSTRR